LRERFHPDLAGAPVRAWNAGLVAFELAARIRGRSGWPLTIARNRWFQSRVVPQLARLPVTSTRDRQSGERVEPILFSYSYAALANLRVAKQRGWRTVLGQIDPGPPEERIVAELSRRFPQYAGPWQPAPDGYWADWRKECELADVVMVNSDWSREALLSEGVAAQKIMVVPLAYEPPTGTARFQRRFAVGFSRQRPLRVLFLGQANLRKGIHDLISVAQSMKGEPVVFDVVGGHGPLPRLLPDNLTFHGAVARSEASRWYWQADLFVLPTHSDGFALTQLEAMAHGLPVIATPRCGSVVESGQSGWIVEPGNPGQLAEAIRQALSTPKTLAAMSAAAATRVGEFSVARLSRALSQLSSDRLSVQVTASGNSA
jgi:glycosyltransferase involved in cell wall biosynthesis